jgi:hypothetical protein
VPVSLAGDEQCRCGVIVLEAVDEEHVDVDLVVIAPLRHDHDRPCTTPLRSSFIAPVLPSASAVPADRVCG